MITVTHMPRLVTKVQELQLSIAWWSRCYAEAGFQKEQAWRMIDDAIENNQPHTLIADLRETARMFEQICFDAWREWDNAKAQLLVLLN